MMWANQIWASCLYWIKIILPTRKEKSVWPKTANTFTRTLRPEPPSDYFENVIAPAMTAGKGSRKFIPSVHITDARYVKIGDEYQLAYEFANPDVLYTPDYSSRHDDSMPQHDHSPMEFGGGSWDNSPSIDYSQSNDSYSSYDSGSSDYSSDNSSSSSNDW